MATKDPAPHSATDSLQPLLADALSAAVRRLLDRSRGEIERAARSGKQRLELRQLQKDLDHFWVRLGKTAYHLVRAGELNHGDLHRAMTRIDELEAKIDELRRERRAGGGHPED